MSPCSVRRHAPPSLPPRLADWQPIELVLLLFVLAVGSDVLIVEVRARAAFRSVLSRSFSRWFFSVLRPRRRSAWASLLVDAAALARTPWRQAPQQRCTIWATFPVVGGVIVQWLADRRPGLNAGPPWFCALIVGCLHRRRTSLNFVFVASGLRFDRRRPVPGRACGLSILTVLPVGVRDGVCSPPASPSATGRLGVGAVGPRGRRARSSSSTCLRAGVQAFERGEELAQRTRRARVAPGRACSAP